MKVLAGDIGGTRIRFAIFDVQGPGLVTESEQSYLSRDHAELGPVLEKFVADARLPFESVCLGIAGPVLDGRCIATNLPWKIDADEIRSMLSLHSVVLINDLVANALGIRALSEQDFFVVNPGRPNPTGNACIIAAGTGLGEAGMFWDGREHQPFPSEGGHCDFAPASDFDYRLLQFLANRHGHVSWERVVSGIGIVNLFEFLCHENSEAQPEWFARAKEFGDAASAISDAALSAENPRCLESLRLFLGYYGAEAGNLALKTMASGGIYIGGGIAPKLVQLFEQDWFLNALCAKGRMQTLLRDMPVKIILNDRTPLLGAAIQASLLT
ncbi:MAG: glucokinase, partial [Methylococcaceae bacterium]|nr:glucokinase [Methylococcaceae bacterium]MCI0666570.1 glucokinase [Methylococcaceae bacterium]